MDTREIECKFLEIDKKSLIKKLRELGAEDKGEILLEEAIIYDRKLKWQAINKFLRLRKKGDKITLSYKEHTKHTIDGSDEIELQIDNYEKAELLFEKIGLKVYRYQQKRRHTFVLNNIVFDIDTWPRIPTYLEIEGKSENDLRKAAEAIGYEWKNALFENAGSVIEHRYNIPVKKMRWFTFDRFE